MPYVVLQQVSSDYAIHNARRTLDKPVALKYLKKYFSDEEYSKYLSKYESGCVYIWGAKLERQHQIKKMIASQTLVLFRRGKRVFRCAIITDLFINPELAENIWGKDDDGQTWGIIYFMEKTIDVNIPAEKINSLAERKSNDNWQGMTSVMGEAADWIIEYVKEFTKSP